MLKKMNKNTKNNLITYGIVIAACIIMQTLISTGSISSLMEGLMVPLCIYIILAVSLNLVVGILGELSLGHAGFMCVGAFTSAFFSKCMRDVITIAPLRFILALLIGMAVAAVFGIIIGIPVLRLKGDYLAIERFPLFDKGRYGSEHGSGRNGARERSTGNHGNAEGFYVPDRSDPDPDHAVHCDQHDQLERWTCDHGDPRQQDRSGVCGNQRDEI